MEGVKFVGVKVLVGQKSWNDKILGFRILGVKTLGVKSLRVKILGVKIFGSHFVGSSLALILEGHFWQHFGGPLWWVIFVSFGFFLGGHFVGSFCGFFWVHLRELIFSVILGVILVSFGSLWYIFVLYNIFFVEF